MSFKLTKHQVRLVLDWLELAHFRCGLTADDFALAGAMYTYRGQQPPPRMHHLVPMPQPKTLDPSEMFHWLQEHNYTQNAELVWESPDVGLDFLPEMWAYCGGTNTGGFAWLPEWFQKGGEG